MVEGLLAVVKNEKSNLIDKKIVHCKTASTEQNNASIKMYFCVYFSCVGGFLFGYDTGIISGAILFIKSYFALNIVNQELIVSVTILSAWFSSLISGYCADYLGRKKVIFISSLIYSLASLLMAFANSSFSLFIGRLILGIAIGLSSSTIPVYIAEIVLPQSRGRLVTIYNSLITGGQFLAAIAAGIFSSNYDDGWKYMLGLAAIPSIMQTIYFIFAPDSPRWLIKQGNHEKAMNALRVLRKDEDLLIEEFDKLQKYFADQNEATTNIDSKQSDVGLWIILKQFCINKAVRRVVLLGCLLQIVQQLAGINTIMYYSASIIEMAGFHNKSQAVWLSCLTAFINFIFTFVSVYFVENLGRRKLVLASLLAVSISLLILSASFYMSSKSSPLVDLHNQSNDQLCDFATTCSECISFKNCAFCFNENIKSKFSSSCLPLNSNQTNEKCSSNSTISTNDKLILATDFCPSKYSYLIVISLIVYLISFASGMGSMPWTINSEIYSLKYRSACFGLATSMNWLSNTLVSVSFLSLIDALGKVATFLVYFCISSIAFIYFLFELPETKGKSLEEIEQLFGSNFEQSNQQQSLQANSQMHLVQSCSKI